MRQHKKLSLLDIAERTGYSTEYLCAIETGTASLDSITVLFKMMYAMDCDIVLRKRAPVKKQKQLQLKWEDIATHSTKKEVVGSAANKPT
jgi:transcriptional regulator with XRE-family HTH domain